MLKPSDNRCVYLAVTCTSETLPADSKAKRDAESLGREALDEKVPSLQQDPNVATVLNAATLEKRPGTGWSAYGIPRARSYHSGAK